jgi:hypothetical protein
VDLCGPLNRDLVTEALSVAMNFHQGALQGQAKPGYADHGHLTGSLVASTTTADPQACRSRAGIRNAGGADCSRCREVALGDSAGKPSH